MNQLDLLKLNRMITSEDASAFSAIINPSIDLVTIRLKQPILTRDYKKIFKYNTDGRLNGESGFACCRSGNGIIGVYSSYHQERINKILIKPNDFNLSLKRVQQIVKSSFSKAQRDSFFITGIEIAWDFKVSYQFLKQHFYVGGKKVFFSAEESRNNSTLKFGKGSKQTVLYDKFQESKGKNRFLGITRIEVKLKGDSLPTYNLFNLGKSLADKNFNPFIKHYLVDYNFNRSLNKNPLQGIILENDIKKNGFHRGRSQNNEHRNFDRLKGTVFTRYSRIDLGNIYHEVMKSYLRKGL